MKALVHYQKKRLLAQNRTYQEIRAFMERIPVTDVTRIIAHAHSLMRESL